MTKQEKPLYTLIPLEDFKALLGVDDREEKLARFCLTTATYTIEQYCKRRFLRTKHFERIEYIGDTFMPLREYPVISMSNGEMFDLELYRVIPDCGTSVQNYFSFVFIVSSSQSLPKPP